MGNEMGKRILLANPRGFCAGVERAIRIVELALERHGAPVWALHEIVHNKRVVEGLEAKGAIFARSLEEIPEGAVAIFSAHGVSKATREAARERGLRVIDATCPLVSKVHAQASKARAQGREVVLVGHKGHQEVLGTLGQAEGILLAENEEQARSLPIQEGAKVSFVTQTTLSTSEAGKVVAALRERFPDLEGPRRDDICYATQNRQDAIRELARRSGAVIVAGSPQSSNSNRLVEVAREEGARAMLAEGGADVDASWLEGAETVGVSAGASAPEEAVLEILERLRELGYGEPEDLEGASEEGIEFALPKELREG